MPAPMKFLMTLEPTADEIVLNSVQFVPSGSDEKDVAAAKVCNEIMAKMPNVTARVWKGHTNLGYPVEVAIIKTLKLEEVEELRLKLLLENTNLESNFPKEEVNDDEDGRKD